MNAIIEHKQSVNTISMTSDHGTSLTPQNLGDIVRFAEVMARADCAIPKHLRDNPGACMAVAMQAFQWEMNPFSIAVKTYKVGDTIAYEAQIIAAVINTRAGLKRRPSIKFTGEGQGLRCQIVGEFLDGSVHEYESPPFATITPKNSPLWKSDPQQQLGYYSIRAFARRHCPEVILGVYDRDELEQPERLTVVDRPVIAPATSTAFGARLAASRQAEFDPAAAMAAHVKAEMEPASEAVFEEVDAETGEVTSTADVALSDNATWGRAYSDALMAAVSAVDLKAAHVDFFRDAEPADETDRETLCGKIYYVHRMRIVKKTDPEQVAAEAARIADTHAHA